MKKKSTILLLSTVILSSFALSEMQTDTIKANGDETISLSSNNEEEEKESVFNRLVAKDKTEDLEIEENKTEPDAWQNPVIALGGGLNADEIQEIKNIFNSNENISLDDDAATNPVTGDDFERYLGSPGNTSSMISSVLVEKNDGKGIQVEIITPQNITRITEQQYINAAITAGVSDVTIYVASVRPVTGESALTGVYKAMELSGESVDLERTQVAQEELETTSHIVEADNLSDEDSSTLDGAIVDIKQQLSEIKERTNELATRAEIEEIITNALDKYGLKDIVSVDNINLLINYFENYQMTDAIDSEQVKEQLSNFVNNVGDKLGNAWQQAEESGLIDRIVEFVSNIFHRIGDFFSNLRNYHLFRDYISLTGVVSLFVNQI